MIIIFDANAFYTYYGREKLDLSPISFVDEEKLKKEMNMIQRKYIATSSFIEILVRFKDEEKHLYNIIKFIDHHKIGLFNNVKNEKNYLSEKEYKHILENNKPYFLKNKAYAKIDSKASLESDYSFIFILFIISSFLWGKKKDIKITNYILMSLGFDDDNLKNEEDKIKGIVITLLLQNLFVSEAENIKKRIYQKLLNGYEDGKVTSLYKNEIMDILEEYLIIFENCIEGLNSIENDRFDFIEMIQKNREALMANKKNHSHIIAIYSETLEKFNFDFLEFESEIKSILQKSLTQCQSNYIANILLKSWLENGAQIKKNDIYDFLLLSILDGVNDTSLDEDIFLVTFDKKIIEFIKKVNKSNGDYIEQFIN